LELLNLVLLSVISILSIYYKNLWPLVSALLYVVTGKPEWVLCHGLVVNFIRFIRIKDLFTMPAAHFFHCVLLGLILAFLSKQCFLESLCLFILPLIFRNPVHMMIRRDSGANFMLFSLACVCAYSIYLGESPLEILLLSLYVFTLILFKALPQGVVFPLVLLAAALSAYLILLGSIHYFVLSTMLFMFLFIQKMNNQKHACTKMRMAFFFLLFLGTALFLPYKVDYQLVAIICAYGWLYFAAQKICQLCVFALKCKDLTLIHIITLSPLLILVGHLHFDSLRDGSTAMWIIFSGLAILFLDKFSTAPMNTDALVANPCVEDYQRLKKSSSLIN
jgi:hypothetical protein